MKGSGQGQELGGVAGPGVIWALMRDRREKARGARRAGGAGPFPKALPGAEAPSPRPSVWPRSGCPTLGRVVKARIALVLSWEPALRGTGWEEGHRTLPSSPQALGKEPNVTIPGTKEFSYCPFGDNRMGVLG